MSPELAQDYHESILTLRHMLRQGSGWSGHERNCMFLNTGGARFANVSATSGFDFDSDSRAVALVDWDHDGDVDLWTSNRTGPRLRFMRNDASAGNHFLAVRLVGRSCNRDAIGARVEVHMSGERERVRRRTLRAGDGFLSQSSKWLHFGLGGTVDVERVVVRWPGGDAEEFRNLQVDAFHRLVQGSGSAQAWTPPARDLALEPSRIEPPKSKPEARAFLAARVPAPDIRYTDFDGRAHKLDEQAGHPVLLNLWASWCKPCQRELREFATRQQDLRASGLRVVALSLDGVGTDTAGSPATARKLLDEVQFPFLSGSGSSEILDLIELLHGALLYPLRPFPIPTSLLIDPEGWVAAIYQGPVEVDEVIADVEKLRIPGDQLRDLAVPFVGRWSTPPGFFEYLTSMGLDFMDAGFPRYAEHHYRKLLETDPEHAQWLNNLGLSLAAQTRFAEAVPVYSKALRGDPERAELHANLGAALAQLGRLDEAVTSLSTAVRLEPGRADAHGNLGVVLAGLGRMREAVANLRKALQVRPAWPAVANILARTLATHADPSLGGAAEAVQLAERACSMTGYREPPYLDTLAAAYARAGRFDEAAATARRAIALATAADQAALARAIQSRLQLYQDSRPYDAPGAEAPGP
ncbi:MAG: tetratricopeptide repeat protein [Candidatus Krumholzibacteriia bacterium]